MPTKPLDILDCTLEELFYQMVIMKNTFKRTVVSGSRGFMNCIATRTKLSAGNNVIQQDFEQWTSKERQVFISNLSNDQVNWLNVGVDPQHLDDRNGDEDSASYRGKAFQTMEGIAIYHDSQMARNHLENLKLKKIPVHLYGEVNQKVKSVM